MAVDLSFLRPQDRRTVSLAIAAVALLAAGFGASALLGRGSPAPAPSPPAVSVTADDIAGVRQELRSIQADANARFEKLDVRLSRLEGYVAGSETRK